jgi:CRISPR-associated protein Csx10
VHAVNAINDQQRFMKDIVSTIEDFSQRAGAPAEYAYLPVTLQSDVILRDHYLLPCSSGALQETLVRYAPDPGITMELYDALQSTRWISGWDELRRMPRPLQLLVQQGSVWVYRVKQTELATAITWWLERETQGIGERRNEGFGCVRLLHPLHAEEREGGW